jgi:hypothetical protein
MSDESLQGLPDTASEIEVRVGFEHGQREVFEQKGIRQLDLGGRRGSVRTHIE